MRREPLWLRLLPSLMTILCMTLFIQFHTWTAIHAQNAVPELPDKNRADLLQIQLKLMQMQAQYGAMQQQLKQLEDAFQKEQADYAAAQTEACKAAKADCQKQWTLNLQTMKFEKQPQTPAPVPEKK